MFFPERIKNIRPGDRVLEIGPGGSPHPRADAFLERRFTSRKEARWQRGSAKPVKYDKPVFFYGGSTFPFKDNEFDYIICSHVIEHVPAEELPLFLSEMQRVGKRGYLEAPSCFYEFLFNIPVHHWLLHYRNNSWVMLNKKSISYYPMQDVFFLLLEHAYGRNRQTLIADFADFFITGHEWKNCIRYNIVNDVNELLTKADIRYYTVYFKRFVVKRALDNSILK
ncbi:MAG: methyltransferase domain-containing protein [Spirochaetota bacterium]